MGLNKTFQMNIFYLLNSNQKISTRNAGKQDLQPGCF